MELTLRLPPEEAATLHRAKPFAAARTGRTQTRRRRIVWHDGLDRALAASGLAVSEQGGIWRLTRERPGREEPWPPATDHRVLATAQTPAETGVDVPDTLVPVAAFDGRQSVSALTVDGEAVVATLLLGMLRAVAAERQVALLTLEGPDAAVLALVHALAAVLPLIVPDQSLAAEAFGLADGTVPVPRRAGAPVLPKAGLTTQAAFAHILGHLTGAMLACAPGAADGAAGPEPVHQMRVAVRRARSALALFAPVAGGPEVERAADGLRALGRILGPARDWDVFATETAPPVEAVFPGDTELRALLRTADRHRRVARAALSTFLTGAAFRLLLLDLAWLAARAPDDTAPPDLPTFAASVLLGRWKKVVRTGKSLDALDHAGLHALRLKAKRLRYAAEFFLPLFPGKPAARFIARLSVLQERLGVFNDTDVAASLSREISARQPHAAGLLLGFTAARATGIRPKIDRAWDLFRRRDPFWT